MGAYSGDSGLFGGVIGAYSGDSGLIGGVMGAYSGDSGDSGLIGGVIGSVSFSGVLGNRFPLNLFLMFCMCCMTFLGRILTETLASRAGAVESIANSKLYEKAIFSICWILSSVIIRI